MAIVQEYSDGDLIASLKSGKAIDEPVKYLYKTHFYLLSNYIEQNNGSREDAEDVFQEAILTFINLVELDKFRGESSVKTFLYAINRNIWLNELKKRGRQEKRNRNFTSELADPAVDVQQHISHREARKQVYDIIDSLGEICKKILLAFYYENLSVTEILQKLDYQNEQVVRNKKAKCMKTLEDKISSDPTLAQKFKSALRYE
jgi:RNA polymerase sigma factor (sigma-70 family)